MNEILMVAFEYKRWDKYINVIENAKIAVRKVIM